MSQEPRYLDEYIPFTVDGQPCSFNATHIRKASIMAMAGYGQHRVLARNMGNHKEERWENDADLIPFKAGDEFVTYPTAWGLLPPTPDGGLLPPTPDD